MNYSDVWWSNIPYSRGTWIGLIKWRSEKWQLDFNSQGLITYDWQANFVCNSYQQFVSVTAVNNSGDLWFGYKRCEVRKSKSPFPDGHSFGEDGNIILQVIT